MQPERFVTCGLVLRETVTRDADKILTVLTPDRGRLSVIARGARRKGSRVAAACQLLAYSEMTLYEKGRWTMLDAADTIELFDGLRQDLTALSLAAYFAELTEAVSDGSGDVLPLLLNALYALSALKKPPQLVKPAFQFRLMALAGRWLRPVRRAGAGEPHAGRGPRGGPLRQMPGKGGTVPAADGVGPGGPAIRALRRPPSAVQLFPAAGGTTCPEPCGGRLRFRPAGAQLPYPGLLQDHSSARGNEI